MAEIDLRHLFGSPPPPTLHVITSEPLRALNHQIKDDIGEYTLGTCFTIAATAVVAWTVWPILKLWNPRFKKSKQLKSLGAFFCAVDEVITQSERSPGFGLPAHHVALLSKMMRQIREKYGPDFVLGHPDQSEHPHFTYLSHDEAAVLWFACAIAKFVELSVSPGDSKGIGEGPDPFVRWLRKQPPGWIRPCACVQPTAPPLENVPNAPPLELVMEFLDFNDGG